MPIRPLATGCLTHTPFAHLLLYLDRRGLSGTLAVWPDDARPGAKGVRPDRILVFEGRLVAGRFSAPAESLSSGLLPLFERQQALFSFFRGDLLGEARGRRTGSVEAPALVATVLRASQGRDPWVNATLDRVADHVLFALAEDGTWARLGLEPAECLLVDRLFVGPASLPELWSHSILPRNRARQVAYLLLISGAIVPVGQTGLDAWGDALEGRVVQRISVLSLQALGAPAPRPSPCGELTG